MTAKGVMTGNCYVAVIKIEERYNIYARAMQFTKNLSKLKLIV